MRIVCYVIEFYIICSLCFLWPLLGIWVRHCLSTGKDVCPEVFFSGQHLKHYATRNLSCFSKGGGSDNLLKIMNSRPAFSEQPHTLYDKLPTTFPDFWLKFPIDWPEANCMLLFFWIPLLFSINCIFTKIQRIFLQRIYVEKECVVAIWEVWMASTVV